LNYQLQPIPPKQIILRTHFACPALIDFGLTGYKHPYKWTSQVKEKILIKKELKYQIRGPH
jgi:hypothetical protein